MEIIDTWKSIFVVVEFGICIFGIFLNGLVILTVVKNIFRLSAPSYFVLSIAVSDFLSCLVAVPFSIVFYFKESWPFGMAGCKAHAFMIFLFALVSITHLAAISVGKYFTITKSLSSESYFTKSQVLGIIVTMWAYSLVFSLPPLLGWSNYGLEGMNSTCSIMWNSSRFVDKIYFIFVFFGCYLLPIAVIVFCYHEIHRVTKQVVANTYQVNGLAVTMKKALLRKQRRSAKYFLVIIAGFMVCWTPYAVVSFISILGYKISPIVSSVPSVFAKISFLINPILYAIISHRFRRRMILAIPMSKRNRTIRPTAMLTL